MTEQGNIPEVDDKVGEVSDLSDMPDSADAPGQGKYVYRFFCGFILTAILAGLFFTVWFYFVIDHNQTGHLLGAGNLLMAIGIYTVMLVIAIRGVGGYKIGVSRKMNVIASQIVAVFCVNVIEIFVSMAITGQFRFGPIFLREYLLLWVLQSVVIMVLCIPMINIYRRTFPPLQIVEIYGDHRNHLYEKVNSRADKYHVAKLISYTESEDVIRSEIAKYDAVLINDLPSKAKNRILKICFDMDKRVYFTPKLSDIIVKSSDNLNLFDTPLYMCRNIGMTAWQKAAKRACDIFFSGLALIVTSPVFLITAICIKAEDGGPVFFRQDRVTKDGKRFMIWKFRSMIVDAEKDGRPHPAGERDPRITKTGDFIRKTRIDELPQLLNILSGDMSIVGPRPERWEHVELYTADIPEFSYRLKVKGGLTGYAQVYGKYNTTALDKLKLDLMYIENYSLLLDVQIVFETIKVLFSKDATEGFTEEDQERVHDMDEFDLENE